MARSAKDAAWAAVEAAKGANTRATIAVGFPIVSILETIGFHFFE
jgi:hypothetical protein